MDGPENADNGIGPAHNVIKKWLRIGVGVVLVGILGALLPIIPGFVFLIPGLVILAEYFPPVRRVLDWAKHKAGMSAQSSSKP
jgi:uncharacterized membrane protein YbaN (DUF454 family)